jgi:hypothetical protein
MRRLDRGEGIELEREARVTGAVEPVIEKARLVAIVAGEAFLGAGDR